MCCFFFVSAVAAAESETVPVGERADVKGEAGAVKGEAGDESITITVKHGECDVCEGVLVTVR